MRINKITSPANDLLKQVRALNRRSEREEQGLFLIEGPRCVNEALKKSVVIRQFIVSQSYLDSEMPELQELNIEQLSVLDDPKFKDLVNTTSSCSVLAVAEIPKSKVEAIFSSKKALLVIADSIQDPGNLGTLIRTAYAAQADGLILSKGSVDAYNPKVVRSAAGALFDLPIIVDMEAEEIVSLLKNKGIKIVACEAGAKTHYSSYDMNSPLALVLGNEGQGLTPGFEKNADDFIAIPMNPKAESLNVAISAGIILFEAYRQRSGLSC